MQNSPDSTEFIIPSARKKISSSYISRIVSPNDIKYLSSSTRPKSNINLIKQDANEYSVSNMIEEKVANLKSKFNELDVLRKKLAKSHSDMYEENENKNKKSINSRIRAGSFETPLNPVDKYENHQINQYKVLIETLENQIYDEKKNNQVILLEKKIFERDANEKISLLESQAISYQSEIESLKVELETLRLRITSYEQKLKTQEKDLERQVSDTQFRVKSLKSTNKCLRKQVISLEQKVKNFKENNSSTTTSIKNFSSIIQSQDSLPSLNKETKKILNNFLETLAQLQSSDNLIMEIFKKIESNKIDQAYDILAKAKDAIQERIESTLLIVVELEQLVYSDKPDIFNYDTLDQTFIDQGENKDFLSWIKCQANVIEDLIVISELGTNEKII
jgi:chromosome segregation ATPase